DKLAIGLRGNHPVFDLPVRHPVFLSVCRTVSWLIEGTISNSTTLSANSRRLQLAKPFGGGPNRSAMTFASCSPSSSLGRGDCSGCARVGLPPTRTPRGVPQFSPPFLPPPPPAPAILASAHAGPLASAFSRI